MIRTERTGLSPPTSSQTGAGVLIHVERGAHLRTAAVQADADRLLEVRLNAQEAAGGQADRGRVLQRPLRDAFAVLFFVSVGMLFDPSIILKEPLPLLATLFIILFGKSLAAYAIVRVFGYSNSTAESVLCIDCAR